MPACLPQTFQAQFFEFLFEKFKFSACATPGGKWMKAASVKSFSKKLACPSSNLLLSFRRQALAREINFLIRHHLENCDFCYCELPLLAYYTPPQKGEIRTPELPINLRLLAEEIFRDRLEPVEAQETPQVG